jgi:hypothetical protein
LSSKYWTKRQKKAASITQKGISAFLRNQSGFGVASGSFDPAMALHYIGGS